jgi:hypothetical protein
VQAYMWLALAIEGLPGETRSLCARRQFMATSVSAGPDKQMSPAQIVEAKRTVKDWKPGQCEVEVKAEAAKLK